MTQSEGLGWVVAVLATVGLMMAPSCGGDETKKPVVLVPAVSSSSTQGGGGSGGTGGMTDGGGGQGATGGVGPSCSDMMLNGNETDVDCGGICEPCEDGQMCMGPADCVSNQCDNMICTSASCSDTMQNGNETDVDCGGADCPPCADGASCVVPADCVSMQCDAMVCATACTINQLLDGDETDVDCGGPFCPPCPDNSDCLVPSDCVSMSCPFMICVAPTCLDSVKNGLETGSDCGGPACPPCAPGMPCNVVSDCTSGVCFMNVCQPPACNDGVENGTETDIDCGGSCPGNCPAGQGCNASADCVTNNCNVPQHICICPNTMVEMPIFGGGAYCVDTTEVTQSQYQTFWNANPSLPNLPAQCIGNNYTPEGGTWPPVGMAELNTPVSYVDWCDAYTYCAYFGKHLCGQIGGGSANPADFASFTLDEWFNACSAQGMNVFPYGNGYNANICNDNTPGLAVVTGINPMPPYPSCVGGAPSLLQMSGNAGEWEDSCDANDNCRIRGGSYLSTTQAEVQCDADLFQPRGDTAAHIGFRCCL
jgi:sulfatase-modifying factor enzyme 1